MAFTKGISGNPSGKPKGIKSRKTEALREKIETIIDANIERIQDDFDSLEPKDRITLIERLLAYVVPKMQSISQSVNIESLPDEQLDQIINQLSEKL